MKLRKILTAVIISLSLALASTPAAARPQPLTVSEAKHAQERSVVLPAEFGNEDGGDFGLLIVVVAVCLFVAALSSDTGAAVLGGLAGAIETQSHNQYSPSGANTPYRTFQTQPGGHGTVPVYRPTHNNNRDQADSLGSW